MFSFPERFPSKNREQKAAREEEDARQLRLEEEEAAREEEQLEQEAKQGRAAKQDLVARSRSETDLIVSASRVPVISSKKWGREAILRFGLYSLAQSKQADYQNVTTRRGMGNLQALDTFKVPAEASGVKKVRVSLSRDAGGDGGGKKKK